MISGELEIALLIVALYGSTCVALVYANEGVLQRAFRGLRLQIAADRVRIAGRSPIWLNPFTPMFPAFRGQWGRAESIATQSGLPARMAATMSASAVLAPYVFVVFLLAIVGMPAALLLLGAGRALPVVGLAYLAAIVLMLRLWFLRKRFALDGKKFALIAFESIVCLPFAAGVVRRLSLLVPVTDDLASFVADLPAGARAQAVGSLIERCDEMVGFHVEGSPEAERLAQYRTRLASLADAAPEAVAHSSGVNHAEEP